MASTQSFFKLAEHFTECAGLFLRRTFAFLEKRNRQKFIIFEVKDAQLQADILCWYGARKEAMNAVQNFLDTHVNAGSLMKHKIGDCVVDEHGRIAKLHYTGAVGGGITMPHGWDGEKDTYSSFMVPVDPQLIQALNALPDIPTRRQLHDLIDWPTFEGKSTAADFANNLVEAIPSKTGDRLYIRVPKPGNFAKHPKIAEAMAQWFMSRIPNTLSLPDDDTPPIDHAP